MLTANSPLLESIRQLEANAASKEVTYEAALSEKDSFIASLTKAKGMEHYFSSFFIGFTVISSLFFDFLYFGRKFAYSYMILYFKIKKVSLLISFHNAKTLPIVYIDFPSFTSAR